MAVVKEEKWRKEIEPFLDKLDRERIPRHVAIIMDGNGRWARARRRPRIFGHRKGVQTALEITRCSRVIGIPYVTLYAFSRENWNRPRTEIKALMTLLKRYLRQQADELDENEVRLNVLGRVEELPHDVKDVLRETMERLAHHTTRHLNLALNYGAKTEIVDAVRKIMETGPQSLQDLDEEKFKDYLYTSGQPDVDLIIRTSGEMRISNFLLYQSAYAELWITDTLWPDFTPREFLDAVIDYQNRERRFGGI